jgi:hypothetical protein
VAAALVPRRSEAETSSHPESPLNLTHTGSLASSISTPNPGASPS